MSNAFFANIGYAITRWAHVDQHLFDFCHFALNTSERKAALVFYRSPNLSEHLVLTDILMRESLRKKPLEEWTTIKAAIDRLLPFRNQLAHDPPLQHAMITASLPGTPESEKVPIQQWWELRTADIKVHHKKAPPKAADVAAISGHTAEVVGLLAQMRKLKASLPKRPLKFSEQSRQGQSPKTAQSGPRTHKSQTSPPRSSRT